MKDDKRSGQNAEGTEEGASLVEYALLVTLIAIIALLAMQTLGQKASQKYSTSASKIG